MNEKGLANMAKIQQNNAAEIQAYREGKPKRSRYNIKPAEQLNADIALLPKAELVELTPIKYVAETEYLQNFKGVRVRDHLGNVQYVQVCGKDYKEVQHEDAYRPIIEGLTLAGNKSFQYTLISNFKKAELRLYSGAFGYDGVTIGWRIENSFTGHSTLNYGFSVTSTSHVLELVGYRQSCANGMVIKVPLDQAEIMTPELKEKVEQVLADSVAYKHTSKVLDRIKYLQYVAEALELLQQPVTAMIKAGQLNKIDTEDRKKLKQLIQLHVGKRYAARVLEQFNNENADAWGLYNAITYVASHDEDITDSGRELLEGKAADMLLQVVRGR